MKRISLLVLTLIATAAAAQGAYDEAALKAFRAEREKVLLADNGWFTVAGLHFLNPGDNTFGSDPLNDIVLEFADVPKKAGVITMNGKTVTIKVATMVASRLPLYEGLSLTAQTINNRALRTATEDIAEAIRGGSSLSAGLKRTGMFPPLLVYLTASGESAGQLDVMLERAADYLEREFDTFTAALLSMLEPAIIVVMGAIVATIVLSILLPILQLQSLAGV